VDSQPHGGHAEGAAAERHLREQLASQPDSADLHAALFYALARAGRFGEAADAYSAAQGLESVLYPSRNFLAEQRARCLVRQSDLSSTSYAESPRSFDNAKVLVVGLPKTSTVWLH